MNRGEDNYKYLYKFEKSTSSSFVEPSMTDSASLIETPNVIEDEREPPREEEKHSQDSVSVGASANSDSSILDANCDSSLVYPPFILDPLSLIIKLAILGKKPLRTKLSITNHRIVIHEAGIFQGIVRYYNNSTKQDLRYLQIPIEIACMQYIILPTYQDRREDIVSLFKQASQGLENLASTYKDKDESMVVMCINHYINLIHNAISMNSIIMSKDTEDVRKYYNAHFMNRAKNIWKNNKLDIVLHFSKSLDTHLRSLEIFMEGIDDDM